MSGRALPLVLGTVGTLWDQECEECWKSCKVEQLGFWRVTACWAWKGGGEYLLVSSHLFSRGERRNYLQTNFGLNYYTDWLKKEWLFHSPALIYRSQLWSLVSSATIIKIKPKPSKTTHFSQTLLMCLYSFHSCCPQNILTGGLAMVLKAIWTQNFLGILGDKHQSWAPLGCSDTEGWSCYRNWVTCQRCRQETWSL